MSKLVNHNRKIMFNKENKECVCCNCCVWCCIMIYVLLPSNLRNLYILGHVKLPREKWGLRHAGIVLEKVGVILAMEEEGRYLH